MLANEQGRLMKKTSLALAIFFLLSQGFAYAAPVTNLQISYDAKEKKLHLEGSHPSERLDRHYIRQAMVSVNGRAVQYFVFPRQHFAGKFSEDLALELQPEDELDVKLICSQGGLTKAHFQVPLPEAESEAK